jgi:hypothetical protein
VAVSGIYDLRPLLACTMNETLALTPAEAVAESPVSHLPAGKVPLTLWVGAEERPEFLRQTRLLCEQWAIRGASVRARYETGKNHFSVIDRLADAQSPLVAALLDTGAGSG